MEGIVCLCGSTRFRQTYIDMNSKLSIDGWIVLSVGVFAHYEPEKLTAGVKEKLDELHKCKIDLANVVLVLDVGGYIGASTKSEIDYAKAHGKEIVYLSEAYPDYKAPEDKISALERKLAALERKLAAAMRYVPRSCSTCKWGDVPLSRESPCHDCHGSSHLCWIWKEE